MDVQGGAPCGASSVPDVPAEYPQGYSDFVGGVAVMRILVVGGVAGGMSFAARARRLDEDAEIVVFERDP